MSIVTRTAQTDAPILDVLADRWSPRAFVSEPVAAAAVAWVVLGPPRLVVTVEEQRVVSKTEGGDFAAAAFPEFAPLISRVLDWRRTGTGEFTATDARAATRLLAACVRRGATL